MDERDRVVAEAMLSQAREDVKHADQKAAMLLGALGVGFAVIVGGQLEAGWDVTLLSEFSQFLFWLGAFSGIASIVASALAVWPRYKLNDQPLYGITYWGHVAAFNRLSDLEDALSQPQDQSHRRESHQLWKLSKLVLLKYRLVRASIALAITSGIAIIVAVIVLR